MHREFVVPGIVAISQAIGDEAKANAREAAAAVQAAAKQDRAKKAEAAAAV